MIWENVRDGLSACQVSENLVAFAGLLDDGKWMGSVATVEEGDTVWCFPGVETEAAAKAAVAHWIGKTMAQLSNALAQGFEQPDDGA